jgi:competence protein ComEA
VIFIASYSLITAQKRKEAGSRIDGHEKVYLSLFSEISYYPTAASRFPNKKKITRIVAIIIVLALGIVLYFTWHTPASTNSSPIITQQNFSGTSSNSSVSTSSPLTTSGDLHVYVVGAIKHPGVYILPGGARVYLLLQDAGGPLPDADLVALNMAAPLTDGEEVYVTRIGEKPPTHI